jgi:hypothetical protein
MILSLSPFEFDHFHEEFQQTRYADRLMISAKEVGAEKMHSYRPRLIFL